jgi:phosphoserine phosphatase
MAGNVMTVIAVEPDAARSEDWAAGVSRALENLGARLGGAVWLAPGQACDIPFDELDPDQAEAAARGALGLGLDGPPVDLLAQGAGGRKKAILLSDMESTVITNEMIDEIADLMGIKAQVADITRRTMNDELDFTTAVKQRVALFKGQKASLLDEAAKRIRIMPGAKAMVATMHAHGAYAALASGGFNVFTSRVRQILGFDVDYANELLIADGKLTGIVKEPIQTRDTKLAILTKLAAERNLPLSATLAIGDGANDLPMIGAAGLGIAFHSHPNVAPRARHRIDHCDLRAALYAQGYRQDEIVEG